MQELRELVRSAGVDILSELKSARRDPDPGTFLGSGKIQELHDLCAEQHADVAIFGAELSPSQERNIERELKCRVVDRTRLILDIFAQRAQSYEGKLQVELAQLRHMSTRLVRGWTHLERQKLERSTYGVRIVCNLQRRGHCADRPFRRAQLGIDHCASLPERQ